MPRHDRVRFVDSVVRSRSDVRARRSDRVSSNIATLFRGQNADVKPIVCAHPSPRKLPALFARRAVPQETPPAPPAGRNVVPESASEIARLVASPVCPQPRLIRSGKTPLRARWSRPRRRRALRASSASPARNAPRRWRGADTAGSACGKNPPAGVCPYKTPTGFSDQTGAPAVRGAVASLSAPERSRLPFSSVLGILEETVWTRGGQPGGWLATQVRASGAGFAPVVPARAPDARENARTGPRLRRRA